MQKLTRLLALLLLTSCPAFVRAQDTGALNSGNWNDQTVWTAGAVPDASSNVYIGSNYPAGAATSATVSLTQDQQANYLFLGNGGGTSGTLQLNGHSLAVTNTVTIGQSGTGTIVEGAGGAFTAKSLVVTGGNTFSFGASDQVTSLQVLAGSNVSTAATGNISSDVQVYNASTLNLGANMSLSSSLDVRDNSALNMNNHTLSAQTVYLGYFNGTPTSISNRAAIAATNLEVGNQSFDLNAADAVTNYYLHNATSTLNSGVSFLHLENGAVATTTAAGNVSGGGEVFSGSTLNFGANMSLSGTLDVRDNSVLNMNNHTLNAATILLGYFNGAPTSISNRGAITATNLEVGNQSFDLKAADTVTNYYLHNTTGTLNSNVSFLHLEAGAVATTTAAGNVSDSVEAFSGSTLNLGANMSLTGTMDFRDNSVLNMNNHTLSATTIYLGWFDGAPTSVSNRAAITATNLEVGNQSFDLNVADTVTNYYLHNTTSTLNSNVSFLHLESGAVATTTAAGNVSGGVEAFSGSTLNLGVNMSLTGTMDFRDNSVLNMNNHTLSATTIYLGWFDGAPTSISNRAAITATNLEVGNQSFDLNAADTVTNYYLHNTTSTLNSNVSFLHLENGAVATTTAAGNVSGGVEAFSGSTLNLGANMSLTGTMDFRDNSVLNMNNHTLSATTIYLGWFDGAPTSISNRAAITATNLEVGNQSFDLNAVDTVTNYYLHNTTSTLNSNVSFLHLENGAVATTTAAGNVSGGVEVFSGSTLNLGADLNLSGNFDVRDLGSVVSANGHNITANQVWVGFFDQTAVNVTNVGQLTAASLSLANGSTMDIHGGVVNNTLSLTDNSVLTVHETGGAGLTLNGNQLSSLVIDPSHMDLIFDTAGWGFRWQDPAGGGNWVSTLNGMIASGLITLSLPQNGSYSVYDLNGYTYIGTSVPEPGSLVLAGMGCLVAMMAAARRQVRRS